MIILTIQRTKTYLRLSLAWFYLYREAIEQRPGMGMGTAALT